MIKYHGTPITPRQKALLPLAGRNFCVSFADPRDAEWAIAHGQMLMYDSGAFTAHTKGRPVNSRGYEVWLSDRLFHPHWALVTDRIGGDVGEQRAMRSAWPFHPSLSTPVWHIHLPISYLLELVDSYPKVAFGSSGQYWNIHSAAWKARISEAWDALAMNAMTSPLPYVHMLRAMAAACSGEWPFASADSTNVARNWKQKQTSTGVGAADMAREIESRNPAKSVWRDTVDRANLLAELEFEAMLADA